MEFGKGADPDRVEWNLPPPPHPGLESGVDSLCLHVGGTGWGERAWVGDLYSPGTSASGYLTAYSRVFNCIELNTTYYRIPGELLTASWYTRAEPDFLFCPKVPRSISQDARLGFGTDLVERFTGAIRGLNEKLGPCFLQLPPRFHATHWPVLERFLWDWPSDLPLHVEFRHSDWFQEAEKTSDRLFSMGKGVVMTDVGGRRDVLGLPATTPWVIIRFVGNGGHTTDRLRLRAWLNTLDQWRKFGIRRVFLFLHQQDARILPVTWRQLAEDILGFPEMGNSRKGKIPVLGANAYQLRLF